MITPINRIPLEDITEMELINSEPNLTSGNIENALTELCDHDEKDDSLTVTMDWAMQLRDRTGMDWGTCIRAAMIAYYG